jgi:hypothetical protein
LIFTKKETGPASWAGPGIVDKDYQAAPVRVTLTDVDGKGATLSVMPSDRGGPSPH